MRVVLISTYELGRQPFGLGSPAAWLREAGADVTCVDVSRQALPEDTVRGADLIAFHVPMHTATRLAVALLPTVRELNAHAKLCFYGLYASVNEAYLRGLGVDFIIGGEFEEPLAALVANLSLSNGKGSSSDIKAQRYPLRVAPGNGRSEQRPYGERADAASISLGRQKFRVPDRSGLPPLEKYARLLMPDGESRVTGYTEASRGCKHLCRHCPIVPVYN
ncbi:MAG TPA: hypothetical protein VFW94_12475, partial [Candidatus Acidoferrales bacterium]|nr:hypothetical protein [Candidatus Acidoferrales bacterium]